MTTTEKNFISYNEIHQIVQDAAARVLQSGFMPDLILAIGGGGYIPARILRTFLKVPIKTVSLELYNDKTKTINDTIRTTQWIPEQDVQGKTILVVDEVDDTRTTLHYCVGQIRAMGAKQVGVFVVHNKLKKKRAGENWCSGLQTDCTDLDFYLSGQDIEDKWCVYPWDAMDIETHTLMANEKKVSQ